MPTDPVATKPLQLDLELPVLAITDGVLFPGAVMRFELGSPSTLALAEGLSTRLAGVPEEAHEGALVAVFTRKEAPAEGTDPGSVLHAGELLAVGTAARVVALAKLDKGVYGLVLQGVARVEIDAIAALSPFPRAKVHTAREVDAEHDDESEALLLTLREAAHEVIDLLHLPDEANKQIDLFPTAASLADFIAHHMEAKPEEKHELLGMLDVKARVRGVIAKMMRRKEILKVKNRINAQVRGEIGKTQREHVLRQQMKAIQAELGQDEDEDENDFEALEKRIEEAKLPAEVRTVADKQLKRLRAMQAQSPEQAQVRNYLDWILDLPWAQATEDDLDLTRVRAVLDADHHGLEKVKRRILEFLAVRKLRDGMPAASAAGAVERRPNKGPILCLIGPPGVGKTSLGKSVARALGRKFHRISLGGVHDEAAIRGHRRTYVGALPGNVIQGLKKVGVNNPVFMLDEVDKLGDGGLRGNPASALLEVLDPEQNDTFTDHYMELPYDLSRVMFIATANVGDTIPAPLRDRMEIIELPGYTRLEKLAIARTHLLPKQLADHGIGPELLEITDEGLALIVERYTREAGVRTLEKQIAAIARGVAVRIAEGVTSRVVVRTEEDLRPFLGPAKYADEVIERTADAGVATGLAWTPAGGQLLFVEASRMPGKGKLTLTGQLGDVMKESAEAALSYVRANTQRWGIPKDFLDKSDIHIHVPAGALPKDGPSAGVTLLTALVSLLTGIRVRHDVAMTGEITLRGRVLPIGGLKEKILAAHRAGIKRVLVPERNLVDLEEVPDEVKREIEVIPVATMPEVIEAALEEQPAAPKSAPPPTWSATA